MDCRMRLTWWRNLMMTKITISKDPIMVSKGENKAVLIWNKMSLILEELRDRRRDLGLSEKMVLMVVVMEGNCSTRLHFVWYFIFLT